MRGRNYSVSTPAAHGGAEFTCATVDGANMSEACGLEACPPLPEPEPEPFNPYL